MFKTNDTILHRLPPVYHVGNPEPQYNRPSAGRICNVFPTLMPPIQVQWSNLRGMYYEHQLEHTRLPFVNGDKVQFKNNANIKVTTTEGFNLQQTVTEKTFTADDKMRVVDILWDSDSPNEMPIGIVAQLLPDYGMINFYLDPTGNEQSIDLIELSK